MPRDVLPSVAILAGGRGERLWPETAERPKPLLPIGGRPVVWHVVEGFSAAGFGRFVVALGHRGEQVKSALADLCRTAGDLDLDFASGTVTGLGRGPDLTMRLIATGGDAGTGARLKRLAPHLDGPHFLLAYADGLADVDLLGLLARHREGGAAVTMTVVPRPERFGRVGLDGDRVLAFAEKEAADDDWINAGFLVVDRAILDRMPDDPGLSLERDVLPGLAAEGRLAAFRHRGFWQCMDTPAERARLESLWASGAPPWRRAPDVTSSVRLVSPQRSRASAGRPRRSG
ncbi:MAG: sugar phosphate nucleotidyltransferase [Alphaproteobacteria bacterium]